MQQIGHYWTVICSGGLDGKNIFGKIAIFGKRLHDRLGNQVLVKAFGDFVWINISENYVELTLDNKQTTC